MRLRLRTARSVRAQDRFRAEPARSRSAPATSMPVTSAPRLAASSCILAGAPQPASRRRPVRRPSSASRTNVGCGLPSVPRMARRVGRVAGVPLRVRLFRHESVPPTAGIVVPDPVSPRRGRSPTGRLSRQPPGCRISLLASAYAARIPRSNGTRLPVSDKLAQAFARTRLGGWLFVNVFLAVIDRRLIPLTRRAADGCRRPADAALAHARSPVGPSPARHAAAVYTARSRVRDCRLQGRRGSSPGVVPQPARASGLPGSA